MCIDETGREQRLTVVGERRVRVGCLEVVGRAHGDDPTLVDGNGTLGFVAHRVLRPGVKRVAGEGQCLAQEEVQNRGPVLVVPDHAPAPGGSMHGGGGGVERRLVQPGRSAIAPLFLAAAIAYGSRKAA